VSAPGVPQIRGGCIMGSGKCYTRQEETWLIQHIGMTQYRTRTGRVRAAKLRCVFNKQFGANRPAGGFSHKCSKLTKGKRSQYHRPGDGPRGRKRTRQARQMTWPTIDQESARPGATNSIPDLLTRAECRLNDVWRCLDDLRQVFGYTRKEG